MEKQTLNTPSVQVVEVIATVARQLENRHAENKQANDGR